MATLAPNWRSGATEGHGHRRRPARSESSTSRAAIAAVLLVLSTMAGIALFVEVKVVPGHSSEELGFDTRMRRLMREELRGERSQALLVEAGDSLALTVRQFYRERQYAPAWIGASGPSQGARDLAALLSAADNRGTAPELCGASRIRGLIEMVEDGGDPGTAPVAYSELDVRLTVGLLLYAREKAGPDRRITSAAWLNVLEAAVARDDPRRVLEQLEHRRELYAAGASKAAYLLAAR